MARFPHSSLRAGTGVLVAGVATLLLYGASAFAPGLFEARTRFWLGTISGAIGLGSVAASAIAHRRRGEPHAALVLAGLWFLYVFLEHLRRGP